ncbi:alpha/beta hydrolase like protein [Babesia gibsoni]|uniref:Alpha/beta hydrolase like protein n=1 Tax=Babesia gibsoni TaxID=33632 RepID=A0AAD8PDV0_BABGI|nr:alpha/beta hydrolase like protein [Babesia gibsoni]
MASRNGNVKCLMSHFRNRKNLLVRTYKAVIPEPKGSFVLVHGNCCHFRAEFTAYNMNWYMEKYKIGLPNADDVVRGELDAMYPRKAATLRADPNAKFPHYSTLDGKDFFDVSPRFIYEGSFVQKLNDLGYDVYGLDLQSHGMSEGMYGRRNYYVCLDEIIEDVIQFVDIVKRGKFDDTEEKYDAEKIGQPSSIGKVYVGGLSMGGNIVLRLAELASIYKRGGQHFIDGVLSMAPMTDLLDYVEQAGKKVQLLVSKFIALFYPSCTLFLEEDRVVNSINGFFRKNDPHVFNFPQCYGVVSSLFTATHKLKDDIGLYPKDLPTLLIHAVDDPVCTISGSRELANNYMKDYNLKYVELDGKVHCITSAMYNERLLPALKEWLRELEK